MGRDKLKPAADLFVPRPCEERDILDLPQSRGWKRNISNIHAPIGRDPEFDVLVQLSRIERVLHGLIDERTGLNLQALLSVERVLAHPRLVASDPIAP